MDFKLELYNLRSSLLDAMIQYYWSSICTSLWSYTNLSFGIWVMQKTISNKYLQ